MKYYEKVDGLRFIAIVLVLIQHFAPLIGKAISAGFYGVDLFFVISGFLITIILLKPNSHDFKTNYKNFIGRRTLRIFPIYYLTILILWLLNVQVIRERLIWFLTYTFNYAAILYPPPPNPVNHFWSLCVEEQFYLFWPFIALSLKYQKQKLLVVIILMIILAYSQYIFNIFPSLEPYNYGGILTRMGSIGLGALGGVLSTQKKLPIKFFNNKLVEYFVFFVLIITLVFSYNFKILVLGLCSFYLVIKAAHFDFCIKYVNDFLKHKIIIKIGTLAYGIYIFHGPVIYYFQLFIFDPAWHWIFHSRSLGIFSKLEWHSWIVKFPLYSLLSIIVAWLSFNFIEKPILRLKNRWF